MATRTERWTPGTPCWADVMVSNVEASCRFYGAVLGWEFTSSGGENEDYLIASKNGKAAAGLGPVNEGMPPTWTVYMASDDVEATAKAIEASGGQIMLPPTRVGQAGNMAVAVDPQGAPFGMWQASEFIGAEIYNEPGGLSWEDARCADPTTARTFYSNVFGYTYEDIPGMQDYKTFHLAGRPMGGIGEQWDAPRPMWIAYFATEDTDAACAAATANGGSVTQQPEDTPYGRMASLTDPDGCRLSIIELPS